jgi:hypothetical protein
MAGAEAALNRCRPTPAYRGTFGWIGVKTEAQAWVALFRTTAIGTNGA